MSAEEPLSPGRPPSPSHSESSISPLGAPTASSGYPSAPAAGYSAPTGPPAKARRLGLVIALLVVVVAAAVALVLVLL